MALGKELESVVDDWADKAKLKPQCEVCGRDRYSRDGWEIVALPRPRLLAESPMTAEGQIMVLAMTCSGCGHVRYFKADKIPGLVERLARTLG